MAKQKIGRHSFRPGSPVFISSWAAIAGKRESEGPLGRKFDRCCRDTTFGEKTWEQAEKRMQQLALHQLLQKTALTADALDMVFSGDLLNQCIGSSFSLRNTGIPHLGLYGACSTMALSLMMAAMAVGGGYADRAVALTSSHFASAERQYRFPLGYGGQRPPTAQWTVTGSSAVLLSSAPAPIRIRSATIGTVTDLGITDAGNMGAAMAPVDVKHRPCYFHIFITYRLSIFLLSSRYSIYCYFSLHFQYIPVFKLCQLKKINQICSLRHFQNASLQDC